MAIESPGYEVVRAEGSIELRRYVGYVTANVRVKAVGYGEAANAGFRTLADYIFGANHTKGHIAMTAPVNSSRLCCQRIAMTAPVTSAHADEDYVVGFTMPSAFTLDDLPAPDDPRVELEDVPAHLAAAIRFSGYFNDVHAEKAQTQLEEWIGKQALTPTGEPVAAQYNAPWIPGFVRRNEILIPVEG